MFLSFGWFYFNYLRGISNAVHSHGVIFVLDCVASGSAWVDMKTTGVDVLLTAPGEKPEIDKK